MAARQANTGPAVRRGGGKRITTKRPLARRVEAEVGQSQAPDWHWVLRLGQLWSPSPREEGFVLLLISWLPNSLHILSG